MPNLLVLYPNDTAETVTRILKKLTWTGKVNLLGVEDDLWTFGRGTSPLQCYKRRGQDLDSAIRRKGTRYSAAGKIRLEKIEEERSRTPITLTLLNAGRINTATNQEGEELMREIKEGQEVMDVVMIGTVQATSGRDADTLRDRTTGCVATK